MQLKFPSALTSFDQITSNAKGKQLALFLDYDGTLSPIVDNPELAFMSPVVNFFIYFWTLIDRIVSFFFLVLCFFSCC